MSTATEGQLTDSQLSQALPTTTNNADESKNRYFGHGNRKIRTVGDLKKRAVELFVFPKVAGKNGESTDPFEGELQSRCQSPDRTESVYK
ncbi:hypothetical protein KCU65_g458, partial [Aureobasidium melanogenum]